MRTTSSAQHGSGERNRRPRRWIAPTAYYVLATLLALIIAMPIVWSVANSFKPAADALADPVSLISRTFSVENYRTLDTAGAGWTAYATNSLLVAAGTVLLTVLLSVPAGYGFSKFRFPGQNTLFVVAMATMMIPFQSILTPLFLILKTIDLQDTLLGLVVIYVTFQLPFSIFMMRNAFDAVPRDVVEAARIDGCSAFTLLVRIVGPLTIPGIVTVALFAFLASWNEFLAALIFISGQGKFTLPIMLVNVSSGLFGIIDWGALQAGVTLTMLPCVVLFLFLQRFFVSGLMAGAVK
jgi:multiple sugar transport system permease protein